MEYFFKEKLNSYSKIFQAQKNLLIAAQDYLLILVGDVFH